jgi:RNA polymerase sigma factor (sigma-70 family)
MTEEKLDILLRNAKEGQKEAENELFAFLSVRFRIFANQRIWDGEDRKEVVQTALTKVFTEYKAVEFSRSFGAWAYKVLDNQILSYIQARRRQLARIDRMPEDGSVPGSILVESDPDVKRRLLGCLKEIGKRNVAYIRMLNYHYQGYSTDEICRTLTITKSNFYTILSRARSLLQACLDRGNR